jgi:hypothetical protein
MPYVGEVTPHRPPTITLRSTAAPSPRRRHRTSRLLQGQARELRHHRAHQHPPYRFRRFTIPRASWPSCQAPPTPRLAALTPREDDAANRIVSGSVTSGNFCATSVPLTAAIHSSTSSRTSTHPSSAQAHGRTPPFAPTPPRPPVAPPTAPKDSSHPAKVQVDGSFSTPRSRRTLACASASPT